MTDSHAFDETMLHRALDLARRGIGFVEPNPAVGAVVVGDQGQVLGEGWHERFGGPHAEVHALAAAGGAARGATLYVTLEPCCHFGKTPPCTQAIIAAGIRRVVVAASDPASHGAGRGIDELRQAGIAVEIGILETPAQLLIAPFTKLMTTGLPWVRAKWAMTLDGKIATRTGSSQWISNTVSRSVVHQLRGRMDAIVTGLGTVIADDPQLTARPSGPRLATRIVLDSMSRISVDSKLVQTARDIPVMVVTTSAAPPDRMEILQQAGVEVLVVESSPNQQPDLLALMQELGRRKMTNILVEAGPKVLGSVFDQRLADEVHAFIAPKLVGGDRATSPLAGLGIGTMADAMELHLAEYQVLGGDVYVHGYVSNSN
ncbi:MAG: bifunctional diaminohydroxyphosphoribosylaminopyrimidine deaminase/5-amino-6-(5-phosphoribosylamino)uracil reductase RibD [Planctomycetes bacterium]|nr:bifunctional diaminohydroxyphosphoribosylaminopyrimidine deaminase/5-amino-6-(5-phosphoribosylamino)uracil reductase RibD [Planctomycetota bacterium]